MPTDRLVCALLLCFCHGVIFLFALFERSFGRVCVWDDELLVEVFAVLVFAKVAVQEVVLFLGRVLMQHEELVRRDASSIFLAEVFNDRFVFVAEQHQVTELCAHGAGAFSGVLAL